VRLVLGSDASGFQVRIFASVPTAQLPSGSGTLWRVPVRRVRFVAGFELEEILMLTASIVLIGALVYVI
jgi:hypothetical protein